MTYEVLVAKIGELIIKRRKAHGDSKKQDKINEQLTKLYDLKAIMLEQAKRRTI